MKPVGFSMKQGAAGSMHTGRVSAACFHWGAFMKMEVSSIFSRFMSAKRKTGRMAETEAAQNLLAEPCIGTLEEQEIQEKNRAAAAAEREKRRNLLIMKLFYLLPYDGEKDFYEQFEKRMQMAERSLR